MEKGEYHPRGVEDGAEDPIGSVGDEFGARFQVVDGGDERTGGMEGLVSVKP